MQKTNRIKPVRAQQSRPVGQKAKNYKHLPVKVAEKQFNQYFLPFLSLPKAGFTSKIPLWKIFNYILYQLHTGCQWEQLPIKFAPDTGKKEIHYTSIWKWFDRWSGDGSFEKAFVSSVKELKDQHKLRLGKLHGDGTNTVAKKGAVLLAIPATSTKKAVKS